MMAINDSDQWVSMIGEILRTYPATGAINLELEDNNGTFAEVLSDLKKLGMSSCGVGDQWGSVLLCIYQTNGALNWNSVKFCTFKSELKTPVNLGSCPV